MKFQSGFRWIKVQRHFMNGQHRISIWASPRAGEKHNNYVGSLTLAEAEQLRSRLAREIRRAKRKMGEL